MQTGTIIDIIGIIVGLSGWAAFWLQIRTNRREVKQAQREVRQPSPPSEAMDGRDHG